MEDPAAVAFRAVRLERAGIARLELAAEDAEDAELKSAA
jgi:hypothetical protein